MGTDTLQAKFHNIDPNDHAQMNALFDDCYAELKDLAKWQLRQLPSTGTITPTVLMHECYLKFIEKQNIHVNNAKHLIFLLGKCMRHFLIDTYRAKNRQKRHAEHLTNRMTQQVGDHDVQIDVIEMESVFVRIEKFKPSYVRLIELKLLMGLSVPDIAQLMETSERTIVREWQHVKSLVAAMLEQPDP